MPKLQFVPTPDRREYHGRDPSSGEMQYAGPDDVLEVSHGRAQYLLATFPKNWVVVTEQQPPAGPHADHAVPDEQNSDPARDSEGDPAPGSDPVPESDGDPVPEYEKGLDGPPADKAKPKRTRQK